MGDDTPVDAFTDDHRQLRRLEAQLPAALGHADAATRAPSLARELIDLLRGHIARENEVLFPMARERLGAPGLAAVSERLAALTGTPSGARR